MPASHGHGCAGRRRERHGRPQRRRRRGRTRDTLGRAALLSEQRQPSVLFSSPRPRPARGGPIPPGFGRPAPARNLGGKPNWAEGTTPLETPLEHWDGPDAIALSQVREAERPEAMSQAEGLIALFAQDD